MCCRDFASSQYCGCAVCINTLLDTLHTTQAACAQTRNRLEYSDTAIYDGKDVYTLMWVHKQEYDTNKNTIFC